MTNAPTETRTAAETNPHAKHLVESDLTVEGLASYGHYRIFASGSDCHLYTAGVEYDRHSWGYFLRARMDYVGEFLPVVLLDAPLTQNIWGDPTSRQRHIVPGVGISPIGFRLLWRDNKAIKPYLTAKGGILLFPEKVLSQEATYLNFSLQSQMGVQARLTDQIDLRLGLFSDFHFSDSFIVPVNPGLDVMNANLGLTYHFGQQGERRDTTIPAINSAAQGRLPAGGQSKVSDSQPNGYDGKTTQPSPVDTDSSLRAHRVAPSIAGPPKQLEAPTSGARARYQIYGGYAFLSNSLNGVPGTHQPLSGFDAAVAFPSWHHLRFKVDFSSYRGTNLGAPQHPYFILGGGQYTWRIGRESVFVEGLGGVGGTNQSWGANTANAIGQTASIATLAGGGLDTPLTRRIAFRMEGGFQYSYFALEHPVGLVPFRIPGLPTEFGRISSGLVWQF